MIEESPLSSDALKEKVITVFSSPGHQYLLFNRGERAYKIFDGVRDAALTQFGDDGRSLRDLNKNGAPFISKQVQVADEIFEYLDEVTNLVRVLLPEKYQGLLEYDFVRIKVVSETNVNEARTWHVDFRRLLGMVLHWTGSGLEIQPLEPDEFFDRSRLGAGPFIKPIFRVNESLPVEDRIERMPSQTLSVFPGNLGEFLFPNQFRALPHRAGVSQANLGRINMDVFWTLKGLDSWIVTNEFKSLFRSRDQIELENLRNGVLRSLPP